MNEIILVVSCLIWFFIGRYGGRELEILKSTKKRITQAVEGKKSGVIDLPTLEERLYNGSREEQIDKAKENVWRKTLL